MCWLRDGAGWDLVGGRVCSGRLKEQVGLGRRAGWSPGGQAQMGEDPLNDRGIFDACPELAEGAAITVNGPPHLEQVVMSISNTRLSNSAQLRRRCAEEGGSSV